MKRALLLVPLIATPILSASAESPSPPIIPMISAQTAQAIGTPVAMPTAGEAAAETTAARDPSRGGPVFEIDWFTVDGGTAITSSAGVFELVGTAGQPDVGLTRGSGAFCLTGGYWEGGALTPTCPGDYNQDNARNTLDLVILLASFGQNVACSGAGDTNGDGFVNTLDLTLLLGVFGQACPP